MESQQLATRVASLESRVAVLEDEGKIVKGEVKQVLTEIRTAILARENPFENDSIARAAQSAPVSIVSGMQPAAKVEVVMPKEPDHQPEPAHDTHPAPPAPAEPPAPASAPATPSGVQPQESREPVMLRPTPQIPVAQPKPDWSLLTIAGLAAWAEDAVRRLGPLRLEILLDMCEAAGHISSEARAALSRVVELDVEDPGHAPSANETVVILRQLDALVNGDEEKPSIARAA